MAHLNESNSFVIEVDNIFCGLDKYLIGQGSRTRAEIIDAVRHVRFPPNPILFNESVSFIFLVTNREGLFSCKSYHKDCWRRAS